MQDIGDQRPALLALPGVLKGVGGAMYTAARRDMFVWRVSDLLQRLGMAARLDSCN